MKGVFFRMYYWIVDNGFNWLLLPIIPLIIGYLCEDIYWNEKLSYAVKVSIFILLFVGVFLEGLKWLCSMG